MAKVNQPEPVKLICGMIAPQSDIFAMAVESLTVMFGPTDLVSEVMSFEFTHYYDRQMGSPLFRIFVAFERLCYGDQLAEAKLRTNELELQLADKFSDGPARPINLDPGYVAQSRLILASMKNFSHRIYLWMGVYAEITLMYQSGKWQSLPWTFPDYASGRYDDFLTAARNSLRAAPLAGDRRKDLQ